MKFNKKIAVVPGIIVMAAVLLKVFSSETDNAVTKIRRPTGNESQEEYSLIVKTEDKEYSVEIPVTSRIIAENELQKYFDEGFEEICSAMPGNNESLNEVRDNLVFLEEVGEYGINVDYTTDDYSLINCFGEVTNENADEGGSICNVTANLEYDGKIQSYVVRVTVFPPDYTQEEIFINKINEEINKENEIHGDEEYLVLPESIDGQEVKFVNENESKLPLIIILILIICLLWYYKKFIVKRNMEKAREIQMQADYSEIVSKLSLLMGAGMSGVSAFNKISLDYRKSRNNSKSQLRYAYEEIVSLSNRIASGISESEAYALFGRNCRSHCYVKLGSLMVQNIKKGGEGFNDILRNEATEAFIERKNMARKAAEEAGTKLLLPMGLMLCVVLVVIIVPAFMSF